MDDATLELKRRVYQFTGDFSRAATDAMVALNTPPLKEETLALVDRCREVGRDYEAALEELLAALRAGGGDSDEVARTERLLELLTRELFILGSHPALRGQAT